MTTRKMRLFQMLCVFAVLYGSSSLVSGKTYRTISMEEWHFNSYYVEYRDDWSAKLITSDELIAKAQFTSQQGYYEIEGYLKDGRGEISTKGIQLKPYTWYEVEIEYQTIGAPDSMMTLAGLYPEDRRYLLDQVILPSSGGKNKTRRIMLHTGSYEGNYLFFAGQVGIGKSLFENFRFRESTPYKRTGKDVIVVDLLKPSPDPENLNIWKSIRKFTDLFGLRNVEYIHPLKISRSGLAQADPGLILFSPTATDSDDIKLGFIRKRRFEKGISKMIRYAEERKIPVLGICAGHQSIATHYGAFLARLKDEEHNIYLKEIGPTTVQLLQNDPIFNNLPSRDKLRIMEAHLIVVGYDFDLPENLGRSMDFSNQIFRYDHVEHIPWYSFQGHIEKDWEFACPEGSLVVENMLANWGLIDPRIRYEE